MTKSPNDAFLRRYHRRSAMHVSIYLQTGFKYGVYMCGSEQGPLVARGASGNKSANPTKAGIFIEDPNECWVLSKSLSTVSSKQIRIQQAKYSDTSANE